MAESVNVWRNRLRRALLEELALQERRAGCSVSVARTVAERRLAAAGYRAARNRPPDPRELPQEIQDALGMSGADDDDDDGLDDDGLDGVELEDVESVSA